MKSPRLGILIATLVATSVYVHGAATLSGEQRQWHKITLTLDGPQADQAASRPNPFLDYRMTVTFVHESGNPAYNVPGYFAADGNAANTSASAGNKWRAHVAPDKTGRWDWRVTFISGDGVAVDARAAAVGRPVASVDGMRGSFQVQPSDKAGVDFRARGRLEYVGQHYLRFAGSGEYFLKVGADAPETFLAYADFDGTRTMQTPGRGAWIGAADGRGLHTYAPHVPDWKPGDPTWQNGKGKGVIGAVNYLSSKGLNAMSFIPYNAGGDGDNAWPFIERGAKFNYHVAKLDQWQIVFDHAQQKGLYLHFKLQETENDDLPGAGGRGGGAAPLAIANATAAQQAVLAQLQNPVVNLNQNAADLRNALRTEVFSTASTPAALQKRIAELAAAELALATSRAAAFNQLQISADALSQEQVASLIAQQAGTGAAAARGGGPRGGAATPAAAASTAWRTPTPHVSLDGGDLGPERKLYIREMVARFGYELALNWNLGEENSQTTVQQQAMIGFISATDPYRHHIVLHTTPGMPTQQRIYEPLAGDQSALTGLSLQDNWNANYRAATHWVLASEQAGKPWVIANDEQGGANLGVPPDPGYEGWTATNVTIHDIRKHTLWGNLMGGGAGVEYYFGYSAPQNDLVMEDYRSRDKSWDYGRIALEFFRNNKIPFWQMKSAGALVGNLDDSPGRYCFAKPGEIYLVYLPNGGPADLDLSGDSGAFKVQWYDPRNGGALRNGNVTAVNGGAKAALGAPPDEPSQDWLAVLRK